MYKFVQKQLKLYRSQGYKVRVPLNSKVPFLMAEYDRLLKLPFPDLEFNPERASDEDLKNYCQTYGTNISSNSSRDSYIKAIQHQQSKVNP